MGRICLLIIIFLSLTNTAIAKDKLDQKIMTLKKEYIPHASLGLVIQDTNTGEIILEQDSRLTKIPASLTKILTAISAYYELSANFTYKTVVGLNENNNLVIRFSADPSLSDKDLTKIINQAKMKYPTFEKIIIDDSIFKGDEIAFGSGYHDTNFAYAAPISSIIINRNKIDIQIEKTEKIDSNVKAKLINATNLGIKIKSTVLSVTQPFSEKFCNISVNINQENDIALSGCWPVFYEKNLSLSVKNTRSWACKHINYILNKKYPIAFSSDATTSKKDVIIHRELASHVSMPIEKIINAMLVDSDNLYSDSIARTLGNKKFASSNFQAAALAIKSVLNKHTGIDLSKIKLYDGSGGSRYNLIRPIDLTRVLYVAHNDSNIKKLLLNNLAISGKKGTLENRLKSFDVQNVMYAKTGSMKGISGLAGYLITKSNKELIVVIMINNSLAEYKQLKSFEDSVIREIVYNI